MRKNKYIDYKLNNTKDVIHQVKKYIDKCEDTKITFDLSSLSIFDAAKAIMVSSAYHYSKFPNGTVICKTGTHNLTSILPHDAMQNLKLVSL